MSDTTVQATGGSTYTSSNETTSNSNVLDKDAFLNLLVTQLKNQDPLNPMEDKEFIAQMAQFSSLEQMQNLSKNLESSQTDIKDLLVSLNYNSVASQTKIYDKLTSIEDALKAYLEE